MSCVVLSLHLTLWKFPSKERSEFRRKCKLYGSWKATHIILLYLHLRATLCVTFKALVYVDDMRISWVSEIFEKIIYMTHLLCQLEIYETKEENDDCFPSSAVK